MSWVTLTRGKLRERLQFTEGKKTTTCCTDNFVPLVAVAKQKTTPQRARQRKGEPLVPGREVSETLVKLLEPSQNG